MAVSLLGRLPFFLRLIWQTILPVLSYRYVKGTFFPNFFRQVAGLLYHLPFFYDD
jgi:hypothetical protein